MTPIQFVSIAGLALLVAGEVAIAPRLVRYLAGRWKHARGPGPAPTRALVDLEDRVRALEFRLSRLEATQPDRPAVAPADAGSGAERRADAGRPGRFGRGPVRREDGPVLIAVPDLASTGLRDAAEAVAEFDRRFGDVWALADEGLGDDEIAARTGYPAGQVELILGLRRPPGAPARHPGSPPPYPDPAHPPRGDDPHA